MTRWDRFVARHGREIDEQYERFKSYRGVTAASTYGWIRQFRPEHWNLALKVLSQVFYVTLVELDTAFKSVHSQIIRRAGGDLSYVYFVPLGYAGSSAEAMRYFYKVANVESSPDLESHFIGVSEIAAKIQEVRILNPNAKLIVVFIDDICGTGDQALEMWRGEVDDNGQPIIRPDSRTALQQVVLPDVKVYFAFAITMESARVRVDSETSGRVEIVSWQALAERERVFSDECADFSKAEKDVLRKYCEKTGAPEEFLEGWSNSGLTVVFQHNCPDNNIPILWWKSSGRKWKNLFRRN